jgi:hypothetical protein
MRVPFHSELDETFRSDRSIWLKIGGCSLVSVFVVLLGVYRGVRRGSLAIELTTPLIVGLAAASVALGALIGLALSLKDTVAQRLMRGDHVNPFLRIYFDGETRCVFAWFVTAIVLVLGVTVVFSTASIR